MRISINRGQNLGCLCRMETTRMMRKTFINHTSETITPSSVIALAVVAIMSNRVS